MSESSQSSARVRDHLANERTFLAWVRTSVSLMGFGVVIARLRYLTMVAPASPDPGASPARSTLLGLAFVGVGLLSLLFAALNFYRTRRSIESGDFQPLGTLLLVFVAVLFALGIAAAIYLLALAGRT
jgi:putative membrane protein